MTALNPRGAREFFRRLLQRVRPDPSDPSSRWLRKHWPFLGALAIAILAVAALDIWLFTCGYTGCPTKADIRAFRPAEGGRIVDRNGNFLGRLEPVRRVNVPLAAVPAHVRAAFVATEDRRFYKHHGLDWRGFMRAAVRNLRAGGVREGFSTITMQVARNTFVTTQFGERTLSRKLIELRVARLLESYLTKDQILENYLNVIYLGNGVYGVEAASRDLFGKHVQQLSVAEGAVLAALPKGPSRYTPRKSPKRALERRNIVLSLMVQEGYLTRDRAVAAAGTPIRIAREEWHPQQVDDSYALDAVRSVVDSALRQRDVETGDITVYTTLDIRAQRAADRAVQRRAAAIQREAMYRAPVEGALVAIDPRTGDVRAMVGGRRYVRGTFNRALYAKRQPGSAFKPFVYATALAGGLTPASMVDDEPVEVWQGRQVWRPENYGGEYMGRVTLRVALEHSLNTAAVRIGRAVGEQSVIETAHALGINSELPQVPSLVLGAVEVTPMELVTAYAPFSNGGDRVRPRLVRRIEAADGSLLWSAENQRKHVLDPVVAYQLTSMLRSVINYGTGHAIRDLGVQGQVAGKTGTTNNGADVWFVGYTPTLVAAVWFGFDDPKTISSDASGGRLAAPAWADFYRNGWREDPIAAVAWAPPDGLTPVTIDAETGELATPYCPVVQKEFFRRGTEPTEPCREHSEPLPPATEPIPTDPSQVPNANPRDNDIGRKIGRALRKIFKF